MNSDKAQLDWLSTATVNGYVALLFEGDLQHTVGWVDDEGDERSLRSPDGLRAAIDAAMALGAPPGADAGRPAAWRP